MAPTPTNAKKSLDASKLRRAIRTRAWAGPFPDRTLAYTATPSAATEAQKVVLCQMLRNVVSISMNFCGRINYRQASRLTRRQRRRRIRTPADSLRLNVRHRL